MGKIKVHKTEKDVVIKTLKELRTPPIIECYEKPNEDNDMVYIKDNEGYCKLKRRKDVAENETIITRKEYLERVAPPEWRIDNEK